RKLTSWKEDFRQVFLIFSGKSKEWARTFFWENIFHFALEQKSDTDFELKLIKTFLKEFTSQPLTDKIKSALEERVNSETIQKSILKLFHESSQEEAAGKSNSEMNHQEIPKKLSDKRKI